MNRVDTSTAVFNIPAQETPGTPGYFSKGNPGSGLPATVPGQDWFNAVQEELLAVIEAAGITPNKANTAQVLEAINKISHAARYAVDIGEANAYEAEYTPELLGHIVGLPLSFKAAHSNTGASTFNPGPGVADLKHSNGDDLQAGDITAGGIVTVVFDGTNYQLSGVSAALHPGGVYQDIGTNSAGTQTEWYDGARKALDAKGAMLVAIAANMIGKLAIGGAGKSLRVNAVGDMPEWGDAIKLVSFSRANNASGEVSYIGAGFLPSIIIAFCLDEDPEPERICIGVTNGTLQFAFNPTDYAKTTTMTKFIAMRKYSNNHYQDAVIKSLDADGCTLTWTKVGDGCTVSGVFLYIR